MAEGTVPMLRRYGITVVAYGPSIHDDDHAFLIRSFVSTAERKRQLEAFYGSAEWKSTYEDRVTELIASYHTVVTHATLG
jgi:hypothetical protein